MGLKKGDLVTRKRKKQVLGVVLCIRPEKFHDDVQVRSLNGNLAWYSSSSLEKLERNSRAFHNSSASSIPDIGDQVCNRRNTITKAHVIDRGRTLPQKWMLRDGEIATVVDIDYKYDHDVRLCNPNGCISGWVHRSAFRYATAEKPLSCFEDLGLGNYFKLLSDPQTVLESCRKAKIDTYRDRLRRRAAGAEVRVEELNSLSGTATCWVPSLNATLLFAAGAFVDSYLQEVEVRYLSGNLVHKAKVPRESTASSLRFLLVDAEIEGARYADLLVGGSILQPADILPVSQEMFVVTFVRRKPNSDSSPIGRNIPHSLQTMLARQSRRLHDLDVLHKISFDPGDFLPTSWKCKVEVGSRSLLEVHDCYAEPLGNALLPIPSRPLHPPVKVLNRISKLWKPNRYHRQSAGRKQ